MPDKGISTRCVHAGTRRDGATGSINTPVYSSSVYAYPNAADTNVYPRYFNTPNQQALAAKLVALEHGEAALVFGSGMAAITTVLDALLDPGDHAVFQNGLYGGTSQLIARGVIRRGVRVSRMDTVSELERVVQAGTRVIYVESPTNPLLRCMDLPAVAALGRRHGVTTIIDNTFATPINQNPLDLGFDVVVHSATKYLNGHSDVNAGAVIASEALIHRVRAAAVTAGGMLDAHACAMVERGIKTLALRMARHNENGLRLARFLSGHPAVARIHYPGLPEHPDHALAARQMRGFGGMVSFELHESARVGGFLSRLRLITPALSLGGVESLVCVPARTSHREMSPAERHACGIADGLIRLSVGIEDGDDLIEDLRQALAEM